MTVKVTAKKMSFAKCKVETSSWRKGNLFYLLVSVLSAKTADRKKREKSHSNFSENDPAWVCIINNATLGRRVKDRQRLLPLQQMIE